MKSRTGELMPSSLIDPGHDAKRFGWVFSSFGRHGFTGGKFVIGTGFFLRVLRQDRALPIPNEDKDDKEHLKKSEAGGIAESTGAEAVTVEALAVLPEDEIHPVPRHHHGKETDNRTDRDAEA